MDQEVHPIWSGLVKQPAFNRDFVDPKKKYQKKFSIGDVVGDWTLLDYKLVQEKTSERRRGFFMCQCVCGVQRWVKSSNLTNGVSNNCGCKRNEHLNVESSKPRIK